jgi:hypothetical protein
MHLNFASYYYVELLLSNPPSLLLSYYSTLSFSSTLSHSRPLYQPNLSTPRNEFYSDSGSPEQYWDWFTASGEVVDAIPSEAPIGCDIFEY